MAITGGTLATLLTPTTATATVPAALAASTVEAATAGATIPVSALAEGVLKTMLISKLKVLLTWALVIGLLVGGVAVWHMRMLNAALAAREEAAAFAAQAREKVPKNDDAKRTGVEKSLPMQVRLVGPAGAKVRRFEDNHITERELPCRLTFDKPGTYRLKLTNIPNRPGLELYPTVEVYAATAKTTTFLMHNAVALEFTDAEIDKAVKGQLATRAVCLNQDGEQTFAITEAPTNDDVVGLAMKKGPILLVARLGSIDLEAKKDADNGYRAALIAAIHHFAGDRNGLDHLKAMLTKHPDLLDAKPIYRQPHKPSRGDDFTPLIVAVEAGREDNAAYLLSKGANIQADDWLQGWTPLHIAARQGDLAMAKLLVKHGDKTNVKDASGRTPLDLAVEKKKPEMVEYLKSLRK